MKKTRMFMFFSLLFLFMLAGCADKENSSANALKTSKGESYSYAKIGEIFDESSKYGVLMNQKAEKESGKNGIIEYDVFSYRLGEWLVIYYVRNGIVNKIVVNPHINDSSIPYTLEQFEKDKKSFIPDDAVFVEVKEDHVNKKMPNLIEHYSSEQTAFGFVVIRTHYAEDKNKTYTYSIELKTED